MPLKGHDSLHHALKPASHRAVSQRSVLCSVSHSGGHSCFPFRGACSRNPGRCALFHRAPGAPQQHCHGRLLHPHPDWAGCCGESRPHTRAVLTSALSGPQALHSKTTTMSQARQSSLQTLDLLQAASTARGGLFVRAEQHSSLHESATGSLGLSDGVLSHFSCLMPCMSSAQWAGRACYRYRVDLRLTHIRRLTYNSSSWPCRRQMAA